MKSIGIAKQYSNLTADERFRLIAASDARGDEHETNRLERAAPRIRPSMPDYAPNMHAFDELALLIFVELLDEAAYYQESLERAEEYRDLFGVDAEGDQIDQASKSGTRPVWQRFLDIALAAGYQLKTKADGWKAICKRLNVPPFAKPELLLGFKRLSRALAEGIDASPGAAVTAEDMLAWLNKLRQPGEPLLTEVPLTVEGVADATEKLFRMNVAYWSGD
jgi:hypothetical protein